MSIFLDSEVRGLVVIDDFHPMPQALREHALFQTYEDWEGPDGEVYKRISRVEIPGLHHLIELIVGPVEMYGMAYRLNFLNETPNVPIHCDIGWGTHALVLYLSEGKSGTAFWKHKETGTVELQPGDKWLLDQVKNDWHHEERWTQRIFVPMQFNRAIIYESTLFHSRYPFEAFGIGKDDGRLIAIAFFTPVRH